MNKPMANFYEPLKTYDITGNIYIYICVYKKIDFPKFQ